jgi:hypothetical protein
MMDLNTIAPIQISDPALITAVEFLQTGDYFIVSWHDFKLVVLIVGAACMAFGYALANSDKIKDKIKGVLLG